MKDITGLCPIRGTGPLLGHTRRVLGVHFMPVFSNRSFHSRPHLATYYVFSTQPRHSDRFRYIGGTQVRAYAHTGDLLRAMAARCDDGDTIDAIFCVTITQAPAPRRGRTQRIDFLDSDIRPLESARQSRLIAQARMIAADHAYPHP